MSIQEIERQLISEFTHLSSWEDRYKLIIEKGKKLLPMPEEYKTDEYKVRGCQSQVWLHSELDSDGKIQFQADSDALIVKGLVALLLQVYSGQKPQDILQFKPEFLQTLGFAQNLSPNRTNGLMSMIKQIQNYAIVYAYAQNQKGSS